MLAKDVLESSGEELGTKLSRNVGLRQDASFKGSDNKKGRLQTVVELPQFSRRTVVKFVHAV